MTDDVLFAIVSELEQARTRFLTEQHNPQPGAYLQVVAALFGGSIEHAAARVRAPQYRRVRVKDLVQKRQS